LERAAVLGMQQAEGADAVKPFGRNVLKEPAQEFVSRQGHGLALMIATVAVAEGHRLFV